MFLVPTCAYPTGAIVHEHRRREILATCAEHDVLVVEDQTPADLVFDAPAPPSLVSMAPDRVVALGSFSKVLWGGLRTGWLRADPGLVLRLGRLKAAQDLGSGMLDQVAVLRALPGYDDAAIARRVQARERYEVLAQALRDELPEWEFEEPKGGWSLWVKLPLPVADEVCAAAPAVASRSRRARTPRPTTSSSTTCACASRPSRTSWRRRCGACGWRGRTSRARTSSPPPSSATRNVQVSCLRWPSSNRTRQATRYEPAASGDRSTIRR